MAVDRDRVAAAVRELLQAIGEDPGRPGLKTTPERVAVQTTHPHDAPGQFFTGKDFKGMGSIAPLVENTAFGDRVAARLAAALEKALKRSEPVTHYGPPSGPIRIGRLEGRRVAFLARHGEGHSIPPHRIN